MDGIEAIGIEKADIARAPLNSLPGMINADGSLLPNVMAALSKTRAGIADTFIDCVGDSTTRTALNSGTFAMPNAWPNRLATALAARGYPTSTDSVCGANNVTTTAAYTAIDPRVTFGTGWGITQQGTAGGYLFSNSADTSSMSIALTNQFDIVEVFTFESGSTGPWTLNVNGGTATSPQGGATFGIHKYTVSLAGAAGSTLNIQRSGSGGIFILGVRTRLSSQPRVIISNCGWSTSSSVGWTGTSDSPYDPQSVMTLRAAQLTFLGLGVNDWNPTVTPLATYQANMQTLITRFKGYGDVAMIGQPQSNPANFSPVATQQSYLAAQQALAQANSIPWFNLQYRWGSFTQANALALMGDDRHPNTAGSDAWAHWATLLLENR